MPRLPRRSLVLAAALTLAMIVPVTVSATHSWGGYHWARTQNPFTLKLGDNVTAAWDSYLGTTSADWSTPSSDFTGPDVLDTRIVAGGSRSVRLCDATTGQVQVCNAKYGNNGWLGVAQIWASGSHITKGTVKVNDTYYSSATYNTPAWRNLVMCQEIGHTLGLNHQDEIFDNPNLNTCMDYTNDPSSNQHPNQHDYEELAIIYEHTNDSTTTVASSTTSAPGAAGVAGAQTADVSWGTLVKVTNHGRGAWYLRDLGAGDVVLTHVFWAN